MKIEPLEGVCQMSVFEGTVKVNLGGRGDGGGLERLKECKVFWEVIVSRDDGVPSSSGFSITAKMPQMDSWRAMIQDHRKVGIHIPL